MKSASREWGAHHPYDSDCDAIVADCLTGNYEDAAMRLKRIAAQTKSASVAVPEAGKGTFKEIARIIDDELRKNLTSIQYACWCTAVAKTQSAKLSFAEMLFEAGV